MSQEVEAYITRFESLHDQLGQIVHEISNDELNWNPIPGETNSPAVLVTHILGAESFRIHQIAGGVEVNRDRESEFSAQLSSVSELESVLYRVRASTYDVLKKLSPEELDQIRLAVRSYEGDESVRWHILHTIEHFGIHLGHLTLTHQLYTSGDRNMKGS